MNEIIEKTFNDLKRVICSQCDQKKITGFLRVRSEKEIAQAIESTGLSKSAILALQWVIFQTEEPKEKEKKSA